MKEKMEILKKHKIGFFKDNQVENIINTRKNVCIYRVYENDKLGVSYLENCEDDDYGYFLANKNLTKEYIYPSTLNVQRNIIADFDNITDRVMFDVLEEIGKKICSLFNNVKLRFTNINSRYTLTNERKLHVNSEIGKNIFEVEYKDSKFSFEYNKINIENITRDITRILSLEDNLKKKIDLDRIIIPTNLTGIYEFFEDFLSCENVVSKNLVGKRIFSNKLSLSTSLDFGDTKSEKFGLLPFFDWEGSINVYCRNMLVENGIVQKPYADKEMSSKYEVENTACSYSEHGEFPKCVLLGAYISPSDKTLNELTQGKAIYVDQADILLENDNIVVKVTRAYVLEGGKLTDKVEDFEITVNAYELFRDKFLGVSKDYIFGSDTKRGIVFSL